jgi:hypothetical protein
VQAVQKGACDGRPVAACEGYDWTDEARFGRPHELLGAIRHDVIRNQRGTKAGGGKQGRGHHLTGPHGDTWRETGSGALKVDDLSQPVARRKLDPPAIG